MFSKACEYGIRAVIHIGHRSKLGKRSSLKEVAVAIGSPVAFTAKVLQALARDGIVQSAKGFNGGYEMSGLGVDISLLQVVNAIDGDKVYNGCGLGLEQCNASEPCPLHHQFAAVRKELKTMLSSTSIGDLAGDLGGGGGCLKR